MCRWADSGVKRRSYHRARFAWRPLARRATKRSVSPEGLPNIGGVATRYMEARIRLPRRCYAGADAITPEYERANEGRGIFRAGTTPANARKYYLASPREL